MPDTLIKFKTGDLSKMDNGATDEVGINNGTVYFATDDTTKNGKIYFDSPEGNRIDMTAYAKESDYATLANNVDGTVSVAHGGTGATDAAAARTNLAITPVNIGAATSTHTHGNITNDGKVGTAANKAVYTTTGGAVTAGTLPVAAGGTGASNLANITVGKATADASGNTITTTYAKKSELPTDYVQYVSQTLTDAQKEQARSNIGIKNLVDGSAKGSLRGIDCPETSEYPAGKWSFSEGSYSKAVGEGSHAEGYLSKATGTYSHAEGEDTEATEYAAHAEGRSSEATEQYSHAEGWATESSGTAAHAEGRQTQSSGDYSHAEGYNTVASGEGSHAEGQDTRVLLSSSHAEGRRTIAQNYNTHAEGYGTVAANYAAHSEGQETIAIGNYSHAEGHNWYSSIKLSGDANALTYTCTFNLPARFPDQSTNFGTIRNSNNVPILVTGVTYASAESSTITAITVEETLSSTAVNKTYNWDLPTAIGDASHSEGDTTRSWGKSSHTEGGWTAAFGNYSHTEGYYTTAVHRSQHVFGEYNTEDPSAASSSQRGNYVEIVGNGTSSSAKSNARTLDWNGNEILAGKLTIGTGPTNNMDVATKQYVDNAFSVNDAMVFKGVLDSPSNIPDTHQAGWTYRIGTTGTYAGQICEVGDLLICVADGTEASNNDWNVVQNNLDGALFKGNNTFTDGQVLIADGVTGKTKTSGFTIAKSVPSDAKFTDTTYTFDGTYNASTNKAATVSTVTNAINALDGGTIGTPGAGKTITALSQTNGNISATFSDISITKSQVSDFPTSLAPTSHTHGNITNDGALSTASRAVVTDANKKITVADMTVTSPTAATTTSTTFIDTVSQASNGKISATKKTLPTASTSTAGIIQIGTGSDNAAAGNHTHGNITNGGAIGTTANYAVHTGTNGVLTASSLAVADPSASGTGITYISSISQDSKGQISATKSTVRDASASQSGIVSTGTQTLAGDKWLSGTTTIEPASIFRNTVGQVIAANANAIIQSPIPKYLWHDVFAFNRATTPKYYTTSNGTTWTEATLDKRLFIHKEAWGKVNILDSSISGSRWTWIGGGLAYCSATWLVIGVAYANPIAKFDVLLETSSDSDDSATWTTLVNATGISVNQNPIWIRTNTTGTNNIRLTITRNSASENTTTLPITSIRWLTTRWGDQGKGSEFEYPYQWNEDNAIFPIANDKSDLGLSSYKWKNIYATTLNGNLDWSYIQNKPTLGTLAAKSTIANHSVTTPTGATSRTADVALNTTTVNSITAVGTLPSLTVTATDVVTGGTTTDIPNITKKTVVTGVTKKTVVTGGSTTDIPNITKKTVVTSATAAKAAYANGVLTISDGSVTTGDSVTVGTAIKAYTSLTTGDSVTVTTGDSVTVGTAIKAYTALTISSIGSASGWSAGTLPTKGSDTTVATGVKTQPAFSVTTTTTTLSHTIN